MTLRGVLTRHPAATREAWPASLWRDTNRRFTFGGPATDIDCDLLIVGAGFTGLWTARHALDLDPGLSVVVVDSSQPGFGASGRNGGWCSAMLPMDLSDIASSRGTAAAVALHREMVATVDKVGSWARDHGVECGWVKGGSITAATNAAHVARLQRQVGSTREIVGEGHLDWIGEGDLAERMRIAGALGGTFTPDCAALNPYRLVDGLVTDLVDAGVRFFGGTTARRLGDGYVEMSCGEDLRFATARHVVMATEAYAATMRQTRRNVAPVYSYVVATAPLPREAWDEIGWEGRETFADGRHLVTYAQRTADGRIVFGGRGAPYRYASRIHADHDTDAGVHGLIIDTLHRLFPATATVPITHRWGGPLGIPRDWHAGVRRDDGTNALHAGGYVGDGVALSHLAGRILAHRVTGVDDAVLGLCINDHRSRRWEPEPLRWLGINAGLAVTKARDAHERRTGRESRVLGRIASLF